MLTGSARIAQEMKNKASNVAKEQQLALKRREIERKKRAMEIQIESLKAQIEVEEEEMKNALTQEQMLKDTYMLDQKELGRIRKADVDMEHVLHNKKKGTTTS